MPGPRLHGGRQLRLGDRRRRRRAAVLDLRRRADRQKSRRRPRRDPQGGAHEPEARRRLHQDPRRPARCCRRAFRPARSSTREAELRGRRSKKRRAGAATSPRTRTAPTASRRRSAPACTPSITAACWTRKAIALLARAPRVLRADAVHERVDLGEPPTSRSPRRSGRARCKAAKDRGFQLALKSGLPIGFATDAAVVPHGENAREFALSRAARASRRWTRSSRATRIAAEIIGWGDRVGTVEAKKFADLVAVERRSPARHHRARARHLGDEGRNGLQVACGRRGGAVMDSGPAICHIPALWNAVPRTCTCTPSWSATPPAAAACKLVNPRSRNPQSAIRIPQ